ncbi:MAG: ATP-binding protein [Rhodobacteraceae bacterium]|nr:ATP-binding protein [Paracoccaceae bacterium]MYF47089.1 ATP-binding protein [Paracoccaceae bacterium]
MFIEFTVKNYRSIKDEVKLSLVANTAQEKKETNLIPPRGDDYFNFPLLRSVAIFGPNAAGKSNLIRALYTMRKIIVLSGDRLENIPVTPYQFCSDFKNKPTTFEIIGIVDQMRFQYGFSVTKDMVTNEWLYTWPHGRQQRWFERTTSKSNEVECKYSDKLSGDKEVWRRATRPNALLLSTAITLNSKQLYPIFNWFQEKLHVGGIGGWGRKYTTEWCENNRKDEIVNFLRSADFAVENIHILKHDFKPDELPSDMPSGIKNMLIEQYSGKEINEWLVSHKTSEGHSIELNLDDESDGTQKIFEFAAPWKHTLESGHIIVYDELHEHLHPLLLKFLIEQFHDLDTNKHNAQLIFSTHDTSVLSQEIFRRDQIWFCNRNKIQATELFPLIKYSPRKDYENLARSYLGGRYGALPFPYNS